MASTNTPSETDGPVTLHFQDITRVAGETIHGRVELNVALAQKANLTHLRIKFRGTIYTYVSPPHRFSASHSGSHRAGPLDRGTAYPEPGSHILSCPFQFVLPDNLPPSFHCWGSNQKAIISYSLEVVGERTPIRRLISIVPAASQRQLLAKESLRQGWDGPWRDIAHEEKVRQGIWGDYSYARVKLTIHDMSSFPIATSIPFRFTVETETKPVHISDGPVDKHGKTLFPALPALASDVKVTLWRRAEIRVREKKSHAENVFGREGGLGDATRAVQQKVDEPVWTPVPGGKNEKVHGIWRRAMHFESELAIPYAPTWSTETLAWQYALRFVVPFPGIGNNLEIEVPIRLDPASACPPPPFGVPGSSSITYADIPPAGPPPPMLDFPLSYWAGDDHAWESDEKN
ncbi:hypothetical protein DFH09DRAFT_1056192 [Mycena vulgaris]|nr:hypothetical protein DFH09DRAFT_1056192 [Mycena vulgaris]